MAVKLLVDEPDSNIAQELAASDHELHAPRLMASEVANALWRKAWLGQVERADAGAALAWLPDMPVRWNDDEAVSADALRLAPTLDHPVYDCMYLALAYRVGGDGGSWICDGRCIDRAWRSRSDACRLCGRSLIHRSSALCWPRRSISNRGRNEPPQITGRKHCTDILRALDGGVCHWR